ncbi:hypothetical protein H8959_013569 [Pygathrix nigripes]
MNSDNLVSVLTQAEGAFVASLIKESSTDDINVWIGLHDPKKNRRWHWSSGSLVSYKSWDIGAPSSANAGYCASLTSCSGERQTIYPPVAISLLLFSGDEHGNWERGKRLVQESETQKCEEIQKSVVSSWKLESLRKEKVINSTIEASLVRWEVERLPMDVTLS